MNKYRLSIMLVLIIMVFLYMLDVIKLTDVTNFAFTCSSLLFSISSVANTFAKENKVEEIVKFVLDTSAICVAILLPSLSNEEFLKKIMDYLDSNVLLLLALFFTMASQWAAEIKWKDQNKQKR